MGYGCGWLPRIDFVRVAILGDLHANAGALRGALAVIDRIGCDEMIFLGDLLTYGIDVEETLELVLSRASQDNAVLLRGNHDAIYEELLSGDERYLSVLPKWIRESVEWTCERLPSALWGSLKFSDEYLIADVLFSHANPYGARRWDYLNSEADHRKAANALLHRAMKAGVFGHTHRRTYFRHAGSAGRLLPAISGNLDPAAVHVLNAGSIGQPRDPADLEPSVLWLTRLPEKDELRFSYSAYMYDISAHLRSVERSGMSMQTIQKISRYFEPAGNVRGISDQDLLGDLVE
jgi:predicted phosphodiesterase